MEEIRHATAMHAHACKKGVVQLQGQRWRATGQRRPFCSCWPSTACAVTLCPSNLEVNDAATHGSLFLSSSKGQTRSGVKEIITIRNKDLIKW